MKQEQNKAICKLCETWLRKYTQNWEDEISQDDQCNEKSMIEICRNLLKTLDFSELNKEINLMRRKVNQKTAWRIEGTLREFPKFEPVNLWFDYPGHYVDHIGTLKDIDAGSEANSWKKNFKKKKTTEDGKKDRKISLENAYEACSFGGQVTIKNLSEYLNITDKTVRNRLKEHGGFWIDEGNVGKKQS